MGNGRDPEHPLVCRVEPRVGVGGPERRWPPGHAWARQRPGGNRPRSRQSHPARLLRAHAGWLVLVGRNLGPEPLHQRFHLFRRDVRQVRVDARGPVRRAESGRRGQRGYRHLDAGGQLDDVPERAHGGPLVRRCTRAGGPVPGDTGLSARPGEDSLHLGPLGQLHQRDGADERGHGEHGSDRRHRPVPLGRERSAGLREGTAGDDPAGL